MGKVRAVCYYHSSHTSQGMGFGSSEASARGLLISAARDMGVKLWETLGQRKVRCLLGTESGGRTDNMLFLPAE